MVLFHFTIAENAERIRDDGEIRPTWPRELSPGWPERVVWLTNEPRADAQGWKVAEGPRVRFTVDVADGDVLPWSEYRLTKPPENVSGLETSARAWGGNPASWFVVMRAIPRAEWVDDSATT